MGCLPFQITNIIGKARAASTVQHTQAFDICKDLGRIRSSVYNSNRRPYHKLQLYTVPRFPTPT